MKSKTKIYMGKKKGRKYAAFVGDDFAIGVIDKKKLKTKGLK